MWPRTPLGFSAFSGLLRSGRRSRPPPARDTSPPARDNQPRSPFALPLCFIYTQPIKAVGLIQAGRRRGVYPSFVSAFTQRIQRRDWDTFPPFHSFHIPPQRNRCFPQLTRPLKIPLFLPKLPQEERSTFFPTPQTRRINNQLPVIPGAPKYPDRLINPEG